MRRVVVLASLVLAGFRGGCGTGGGADPCAGTACGDPCTAEGVAGRCDPAGTCLELGLPVPACPPVTDCTGRACGTPCLYPCHLDGTCSPPTVALACNGDFSCGPIYPWSRYQPCAGKSCGDDCHVCPPYESGCGETGELKACNSVGRCVSRTPDLTCR